MASLKIFPEALVAFYAPRLESFGVNILGAAEKLSSKIDFYEEYDVIKYKTRAKKSHKPFHSILLYISMFTKNFISLTKEQKNAVHKESATSASYGRENAVAILAAWVKENYFLPSLPGRTMDSLIIHTGPVRHPSITALGKKTRNKHGLRNELEKRLQDWGFRQGNRIQNVKWKLIYLKLRRLQEKLAQNTCVTLALTFTFSERQLSNFKRMLALNSYRSHGESGDADQALFYNEMQDLPKFHAGYGAKNIFNTDECGVI